MDSTTAARRKVFISYAHEDQDLATRLKGDLEGKGVRVWIDHSGIKGGDAWVKKIHEGLRVSNEVVFIDSPAARDSDAVQSELIIAKARIMRITPLQLGSNYEPWYLTATSQNIDFTDYDDGFAKLMALPPPPWTLWRRVLILRNKVRAYRAYLGVLIVAIAIVTYAYFFSPSNTSFIVTGDDKSAILVQVRNRGGRPSTLIGSSFKLDFGNLPIESEPLVLLQPEQYSRIAGHSDVIIHLTAHNMLDPKTRDEESYFTEADIRPLLSGAKLTLTAQVKESDHRFHTRSDQFLGARIPNFVLEEFPNDVPSDQPL